MRLQIFEALLRITDAEVPDLPFYDRSIQSNGEGGDSSKRQKLITKIELKRLTKQIFHTNSTRNNTD